MKVLSKNGISREYAKRALDLAREKGAFTIFALVDALPPVSGQIVNAGERLDMDAKAAQHLLAK